MRRLTPKPACHSLRKRAIQPGFPTFAGMTIRRVVATRTRVVMDYVVELTREISALLAQGAEVLT